MTPRSMDSLDVVEMVMAFEEAFDVEIPGDDLGRLDNPSEIVDRLERVLSNQRPNNAAKASSESSQTSNNGPNWLRG